MVLEKVKEIIADQLDDISVDDIKAESSLIDDLKANSVDVVGIIMALEGEYELEFPYEDIESISTVGDAVKYIEANL